MRLNRLLPLAFLLTLTACHNPLHDFVEETIELNVENLAAEARPVGSLEFVRYTQEPYQEQVCDTYVCGYDRHYVCHDYPRCGYVNGHYVCEGYHRECHWEEYPRYCQGNCRWETRYRTIKHNYHSRILAQIEGYSSGRIEELTLGVETNQSFQEALRNPDKRPSEYREQFDKLRATDRTLLGMKAKGLELVPDENFVSLPENFRLGDDIFLRLRVRPTGSDDSFSSVIGTQNRIPQ